MRLGSTAQQLAAAATGLALLGGGLFAARPASADSVEWCWDDPIVYVDGVQQAVTVGLRTADRVALQGRTPVVVTLYAAQGHTITVPASQPAGAFPVVTNVVPTNVPSPGTGYTVLLVTTVSASRSVPVQVDMRNGNGTHTVLTGTSDWRLFGNFSPLMPASPTTI